MTRLEAALAYASWGWPVLPIVPNGKLPATAHGVHDASTDPDQIRKWFEGRDDLNIGIAAGSRSGLVVFDIDPRNGGDDSYAEWTAKHGALPDGALQLTAGGGQHYLAAHDPSIRSCKLVDGVDLLADGRYFLAFPSTIEGRAYRWEVSSDPFDGVAPASIPDAWREAMRPVERKSPVTPGAALIQGNRNNGLFSLASAMRYHGMTAPEILGALVVVNEERCEIPLPASEVKQIVASAMKYEPEHDTAANAAMADDAVADLLAKVEAQRTSEYFLTRATAFLSEPAPLRWLIKGWVPESGVTMVFGESGAGKTFITLDMACRIATGLDWHGQRAKKGVVVYLCGEGNFGFRQRVAAWAKMHGRTDLDLLLVSNKAIDLDAPNAAAQILSAVRTVTDGDVEAVFVDTVNNHMSGDENSARDVRNMFGACNVVASALNATVVLNHHTGHNIDAKGRARGSSAWKASLDASILVSKGDDGTIEVSCTKMKDAEPPSTFAGRLDSVALGWVDEDGEEVQGAVFVKLEGEATPTPKRPSKIDEARRQFERAWAHAGMEWRADRPYVSRAALKAWCIECLGDAARTATNKADASREGSIAHRLITAGVIELHEHGWVAVDELVVQAARLCCVK